MLILHMFAMHSATLQFAYSFVVYRLGLSAISFKLWTTPVVANFPRLAVVIIANCVTFGVFSGMLVTTRVVANFVKRSFCFAYIPNVEATLRMLVYLF